MGPVAGPLILSVTKMEKSMHPAGVAMFGALAMVEDLGNVNGGVGTGPGGHFMLPSSADHE